MQIVSIIIFLSSSGFKLLFRDANDVRRIKAKMFSDGVRFQDLSYREMEKLRQVGGRLLTECASVNTHRENMVLELGGSLE